MGWGSTEGHLKAAATEVGCALAHFNFINPLPRNTRSVLARYKKIVVCELNNGQFLGYLRTKFPECPMHQYNKIMGLPFQVSELKDCFTKILGE